MNSKNVRKIWIPSTVPSRISWVVLTIFPGSILFGRGKRYPTFASRFRCSLIIILPIFFFNTVDSTINVFFRWIFYQFLQRSPHKCCQWLQWCSQKGFSLQPAGSYSSWLWLLFSDLIVLDCEWIRALLLMSKKVFQSYFLLVDRFSNSVP